MAVATHSSTATEAAAHSANQAHTRVRHAPVTPGKVAMWLFLATEVMFFTGLIGSYIVLRAGSTHDAYSNLYSPATPLKGLEKTQGVLIESDGGKREEIEHILQTDAGLTAEQAESVLHAIPHGLVSGLREEKAKALIAKLTSAGATAEEEPLKMYSWPQPYDLLVNPLAINLTAFNTFVLICSSVTMVLSLSAIQDGKRSRGNLFLGATVLIGSFFLSIQVYEYYQLMIGHHYPPGISATTHFRPSVSLFASCFFTMTGFHGAHVTGGVILLATIFVRSFFFKAYSKDYYAPLELAGLYWHFVDLVWIILFTIVYLI
jgi:cytochrome c oxidase subunit III